MLEPLFSKVAACSFIKKRLQLKCFPVKFAKFLRTPNLKNICETTASDILFLGSSKRKNQIICNYCLLFHIFAHFLFTFSHCFNCNFISSKFNRDMTFYNKIVFIKMNYLYLLSKLLSANISSYICTCLNFFNEN